MGIHTTTAAAAFKCDVPGSHVTQRGESLAGLSFMQTVSLHLVARLGHARSKAASSEKRVPFDYHSTVPKVFLGVFQMPADHLKFYPRNISCPKLLQDVNGAP